MRVAAGTRGAEAWPVSKGPREARRNVGLHSDEAGCGLTAGASRGPFETDRACDRSKSFLQPRYAGRCARVVCRRARHSRTFSPAVAVHTKKSGMKSTAMNVAASMPPITPVPME